MTKVKVVTIGAAILCVVLAIGVAYITLQPVRPVTSHHSDLTTTSTIVSTLQPVSSRFTWSMKITTEHGALSPGPPIMQSMGGIFNYYTFLNEWVGIIDGVRLNAYAGSRNSREVPTGSSGIGGGALLIYGNIDNGTELGINVGGLYSPPQDHGSMKIIDEAGGILLLHEADGSSLRFDLVTLRWLNP